MSTKKISLPVEVVPTGVESLIWRVYDQGKERKKSPWSLCVHEGFNDQSQNVSSTLCWWHVDASKSKEEINKLNELLSQSSKWNIWVQLGAYLVLKALASRDVSEIYSSNHLNVKLSWVAAQQQKRKKCLDRLTCSKC